MAVVSVSEIARPALSLTGPSAMQSITPTIVSVASVTTTPEVFLSGYPSIGNGNVSIAPGTDTDDTAAGGEDGGLGGEGGLGGAGGLGGEGGLGGAGGLGGNGGDGITIPAISISSECASR